jgi:hypothetical protein
MQSTQASTWKPEVQQSIKEEIKQPEQNTQTSPKISATEF